jgi:phosphate transport system protein
MNREPRHFAAELEELKTRLLTMGKLAEERLHAAMRALVDRQPDVLADVASGDSRIDELQIEIDGRCFKLIALYQPVAGDLILMSRHLERVGDHATNIAEDVIFIVEARDVRHRRTMQVLIERRNTADTAPV